jgi:hypothetical protein
MYKKLEDMHKPFHWPIGPTVNLANQNKGEIIDFDMFSYGYLFFKNEQSKHSLQHLESSKENSSTVLNT